MKCILAILLSAALFAKPIDPRVEKPTVVILGGGIGALTSALYLGRAGYEPFVIEGRVPGGALTQTHQIQNWPGELEIDGATLIEKIHAQVESNGAHFIGEEVVDVDFSQRPFQITLKSLDGKGTERHLYADACIIAVGATPHFLGIPGELGPNGYWGKGVSHCTICDGALYRDQIVGVVGGGDAAVVEALYLSKIAKEVHIFVRKDKFKALETKRLQALLELPNVTVHYQTVIEEIRGDGEKLTEVVIRGKSFPIDGLFLAIGSKPNTDLFKNRIKLDKKGYILLEKGQQTSVEGVYAIGDVVDPIYKQAISAAGDGCKAALQLQDFLSDRQPRERIKMAFSTPLTQQKGVIEITSKSQLEEELKGELPVVVDFYATWCGPCKLLSPLFEHSAEALSGKVKFLKVNVDQCGDLARDYGIRAMPTVLVFHSSGKLSERTVGTDQIASFLKKLEAEKGS